MISYYEYSSNNSGQIEMMQASLIFGSNQNNSRELCIQISNFYSQICNERRPLLMDHLINLGVVNLVEQILPHLDLSDQKLSDAIFSLLSNLFMTYHRECEDFVNEEMCLFLSSLCTNMKYYVHGFAICQNLIRNYSDAICIFAKTSFFDNCVSLIENGNFTQRRSALSLFNILLPHILESERIKEIADTYLHILDTGMKANRIQATSGLSIMISSDSLKAYLVENGLCQRLVNTISTMGIDFDFLTENSIKILINIVEEGDVGVVNNIVETGILQLLLESKIFDISFYVSSQKDAIECALDLFGNIAMINSISCQIIIHAFDVFANLAKNGNANIKERVSFIISSLVLRNFNEIYRLLDLYDLYTIISSSLVAESEYNENIIIGIRKMINDNPKCKEDFINCQLQDILSDIADCSNEDITDIAETIIDSLNDQE